LSLLTTGVTDTGVNLPLVFLTLMADLPPVINVNLRNDVTPLHGQLAASVVDTGGAP
jgi:hypothetical protein